MSPQACRPRAIRVGTQYRDRRATRPGWSHSLHLLGLPGRDRATWTERILRGLAVSQPTSRRQVFRSHWRVLSLVLAPETIDHWGWRIPFFIGCMIIPLILLMRRSLAESGEFLAWTKRPTTSEILRTLGIQLGYYSI
jgi:hypothetical protein